MYDCLLSGKDDLLLWYYTRPAQASRAWCADSSQQSQSAQASRQATTSGLHQARLQLLFAACRLPFAHAQQLEAQSPASFLLVSTLVVKMKVNTIDAPYVFEKGTPAAWRFSLSYAKVDAFLPLAHQCLAACRLPYVERDAALAVRVATHSSRSHPSQPLQPPCSHAEQPACPALHAALQRSLRDLQLPCSRHRRLRSATASCEGSRCAQAIGQRRAAEAPFDASRLVDFAEARLVDLPATLLSPLVQEPGRLVITAQHLCMLPALIGCKLRVISYHSPCVASAGCLKLHTCWAEHQVAFYSSRRACA